jgi:HemY protein
MIRAIFFLIKVGLLVAAAIWISDQKGSVEIDWGHYKIIFPHVGFFLMAVVAVVLLAIFTYRAIQTFAQFPRSYRRYREISNQKKGFRALTLGLTAVAAGDKKAAKQQSAKASKLLPEDEGLPLLLKAQSEKLEGREKQAQETFATLTKDKDAGFLGVRGLLLAAIEARNHGKALELARQALKLHPRQPWILKLVYDLEIRQRHWDEAQKILSRAAHAGAIPAAQAASDKIAILLARAAESQNEGLRSAALTYLRQAYKADTSFVPAALALARFYKENGSRRKAASVIEGTWKKNPHPDLARLWETLVPAAKAGKISARYAWAEKLAALNPTHPESHLLAGRVAMEESLWGAAREHFRQAENIEPTARLYWQWANLEKRAGSGASLVQSLQEKASSFPSERCWVCRDTGRIYEQWFPVADPHGSFNTIEWDQPRGFGNRLLTEENSAPDVVLDVPRGSLAS